MDDASKAGLRCVMRAYGWERRQSPTAICRWDECYTDVSLQDDYSRAAWSLLEDVLCRPDGAVAAHHEEEAVKMARCAVEGVPQDVRQLHKDVLSWQERTGTRLAVWGSGFRV